MSHELGVPELRVIGTSRLPDLVFYVPDEDTVDIWRVLRSRRDIPAHRVDDR